MEEASLQERINFSEWMISGLSAHSEKLSERGLDKDFVERYYQIIRNVMVLGEELEALKELVREKSSRMSQALDDLNKFYVVACKIVRLDLPKEKWKEFGIEDLK